MLNKQALRISIIFLIISILWIFFSDRLLLKLVNDSYTLTQIQTFKGWFYVLILSFTLYFLVKEEIKKALAQKRRFKEEKSKRDILFESLNNAIFVLDEENRFYDCNSKTLEIFECTREDLMNIHLADVSPKLQPNGVKSFELADEKIRLTREGDAQKFEWIHTNFKRNKEFYTEISLSSIKISDVIYVIAIIHDVSIRKKYELDLKLKNEELNERNIELSNAEEELRTNNIELKELNDQLQRNEYLLTEAQKIAQIGHWEWDIVNDKLSWSDEVYRIFGKELGFEVSSDSFLKLVHPEDRNKIHEAFQRTIENKSSYEVEHRIVLDNGKIKNLLEKSRIEYSKEGKPIRSIGIVQDITNHVITQKIIKESEERYRLLSDLGKAGIVIHKNGIVQEVNNTFCRIFQYTREELIGEDIMERLFAGDYAEMVRGNIKSNLTRPYFVKCLRKDGRERWFEIEARNFLYKDEPARVATFLDITESVEREEELKLGAEKHRVLYENALVGLSVTDSKTRRLLQCNEKYANIFGYSSIDEILNDKGFGDYYLDKKLRNQLFDVFNEKGEINNIELNVRKRNGENIWIELSSYKNKVTGNVESVVKDITAQKLAQLALKENEEKYRRLTENSPAITYIYSLKRGALYWSSRAKEILGFDLKNLKNDRIKWDEAIHPDDKPRIDEFLQNIKVGETYTTEYRIYDVNNKLHWFNDRIFNVYKSNEEIIIEGIISDVTDKQRMQQKVLHAMINAEERERSRIAKDLHDGVSPVMSAIKLYIQSLSGTTKEKLRHELIGKISNTINEAISSINEISNNVSPHVLQNFGLKTAVESFVTKISELKGIYIDLHFEIDNRFDENTEIALYRITTELINNTIKYAKAHDIKIKYYLTHGHIFMLYKDNGKGFNTEKVLNNKTGMGIFNMKNRINSLNGEFKLESIEKEGVYVEIMVPVNS